MVGGEDSIPRVFVDTAELLLVRGDEVAVFIKDNEAGAGGALIDGSQEARLVAVGFRARLFLLRR